MRILWVSELPEDEVREIIRKYYDAPGTHEESMQAVMNYIHEKEPEWRKLYFKNEALDNNSRIQPMTERQKEEAEALARQIRPEMPNMFTDDIADMIYGAGRIINGMSGGGLDYLGERYGIDTRMNDYLSLKDEEGIGNLARNLGNMTQFGGMGLGMYGLGSTGINIMRPYYNSWQIGRAYDRLKQNPFQGSGKDVITRMKNHNGETVILQRGEAIPGENGQVIAAGKPLLREYGTKRNYGLNKAIYKHDVPRNETTQIPRYIKKQPVEISPNKPPLVK